MLGGSVAEMFVDSSDHVAHVILLEEGCHFFVDVFGPFVCSERARVVSDHGYESFVGMNEMVLVGEEIDGLCSGGCADEDHEIFVAFVRFGGDFAAKVAVDVFPWDS